jgi:hypothetical protein
MSKRNLTEAYIESQYIRPAIVDAGWEDIRIIEEGTHDRFMAQAGHYAELYNTTFRHQSLEVINAKSWRLEFGDVADD